MTKNCAYLSINIEILKKMEELPYIELCNRHCNCGCVSVVEAGGCNSYLQWWEQRPEHASPSPSVRLLYIDTLYCALHSALYCTLCNTHSKLCNTHSIVCNTHSIGCNTHYLVCNTNSILCNTHYLVCNTHSILCNTHSALCNTHSTLCNKHCTLCNPHYALPTLCYTLHYTVSPVPLHPERQTGRKEGQ